MTTTTTHRLYGYEESCTDTVRAMLFGVLADLAWPIVQKYRSDLYRDVQWMDKYVTGPIVFEFVARSSGTHIGTDVAGTLFHHGDRHGALCGDDAARLYRVALREERGVWFADVKSIVPVDCPAHSTAAILAPKVTQ